MPVKLHWLLPSMLASLSALYPFVNIVYTGKYARCTVWVHFRGSCCLQNDRRAPQVMDLTEFQPISAASGRKAEPERTYTQVRDC